MEGPGDPPVTLHVQQGMVGAAWPQWVSGLQPHPGQDATPMSRSCDPTTSQLGLWEAEGTSPYRI